MGRKLRARGIDWRHELWVIGKQGGQKGDPNGRGPGPAGVSRGVRRGSSNGRRCRWVVGVAAGWVPTAVLIHACTTSDYFLLHSQRCAALCRLLSSRRRESRLSWARQRPSWLRSAVLAGRSLRRLALGRTREKSRERRKAAERKMMARTFPGYPPWPRGAPQVRGTGVAGDEELG